MEVHNESLVPAGVDILVNDGGFKLLAFQFSAINTLQLEHTERVTSHPLRVVLLHLCSDHYVYILVRSRVVEVLLPLILSSPFTYAPAYT